jgi:hypothetical protein
VNAGDKVGVWIHGSIERNGGTTNILQIYFHSCYQDSSGALTQSQDGYLYTNAAGAATYVRYHWSNSAIFTFAAAGTYNFGACVTCGGSSDPCYFRYVDMSVIRFQ